MEYVYACQRCKDTTDHALEWIKVKSDLKTIEFGVRCTTMVRGKPCNTFQIVECRIERKE